ncbi:unnamed protein product [Caenorhabditis angaria]|uniref:Methionine--tRNA ligase, mitochondrial n=1 Tax=Caenorhabditis angaria TaxID=860376 RepID=A0A9P1I698_9PELO|nr:unnamed protein product [Caenorhabditis angaria]
MLKNYVTAPIFYANAEPHIGHAYTAILCDAAHRWNLLRNPKKSAIFSIGTDEHGSKIFRAAQNAKKDPQEFCDEVSSKFSRLFEKLGISNTHFIRTTNSEHKKAVQKFWETLDNKGLIYKSKYSGYYSIVDECFFPENEVEQKGESKVVKNTSTIVEWIEEENYMFKLSQFRDPVREWINKTAPIFPRKYENLALDSLEMSEDLSISRSKNRLSWGIPVPNDESQTIYVWLDALVNYLTVAGYPNDKWEENWSPSCQVIGKDIVKFHCFYWPAFLLAANIPLPSRFFVHGHWLVDNVKMSKSLGNVIDPNWACQKYTSEGLRYFLLKNGNPNDDSSFNTTSCLETINSDIVNNIGNLLNRSTVDKMNPGGKYPRITVDEMDVNVRKSYEGLIAMLDEVTGKVIEYYDEMLYYKAIELLMGCMKESNRVFQLNQPWKQKDEHVLASIYLPTYESLRIISILLQPIIPKFAEFSLNRLGVAENERSLEHAKFGKCSNSNLGPNNGIFIERLQK